MQQAIKAARKQLAALPKDERLLWRAKLQQATIIAQQAATQRAVITAIRTGNQQAAVIQGEVAQQKWTAKAKNATTTLQQQVQIANSNVAKMRDFAWKKAVTKQLVHLSRSLAHAQHAETIFKLVNSGAAQLQADKWAEAKALVTEAAKLNEKSSSFKLTLQQAINGQAIFTPADVMNGRTFKKNITLQVDNGAKMDVKDVTIDGDLYITGANQGGTISLTNVKAKRIFVQNIDEHSLTTTNVTADELIVNDNNGGHFIASEGTNIPTIRLASEANNIAVDTNKVTLPNITVETAKTANVTLNGNVTNVDLKAVSNLKVSAGVKLITVHDEAAIEAAKTAVIDRIEFLKKKLTLSGNFEKTTLAVKAVDGTVEIKANTNVKALEKAPEVKTQVQNYGYIELAKQEDVKNVSSGSIGRPATTPPVVVTPVQPPVQEKTIHDEIRAFITDVEKTDATQLNNDTWVKKVYTYHYLLLKAKYTSTSEEQIVATYNSRFTAAEMKIANANPNMLYYPITYSLIGTVPLLIEASKTKDLTLLSSQIREQNGKITKETRALLPAAFLKEWDALVAKLPIVSRLPELELAIKKAQDNTEKPLLQPFLNRVSQLMVSINKLEKQGQVGNTTEALYNEAFALVKYGHLANKDEAAEVMTLTSALSTKIDPIVQLDLSEPLLSALYQYIASSVFTMGQISTYHLYILQTLHSEADASKLQKPTQVGNLQQNKRFFAPWIQYTELLKGVNSDQKALTLSEAYSLYTLHSISGKVWSDQELAVLSRIYNQAALNVQPFLPRPTDEIKANIKKIEQINEQSSLVEIAAAYQLLQDATILYVPMTNVQFIFDRMMNFEPLLVDYHEAVRNSDNSENDFVNFYRYYYSFAHMQNFTTNTLTADELTAWQTKIFSQYVAYLEQIEKGLIDTTKNLDELHANQLEGFSSVYMHNPAYTPTDDVKAKILDLYAPLEAKNYHLSRVVKSAMKHLKEQATLSQLNRQLLLVQKDTETYSPNYIAIAQKYIGQFELALKTQASEQTLQQLAQTAKQFLDESTYSQKTMDDFSKTVAAIRLSITTKQLTPNRIVTGLDNRLTALQTQVTAAPALDRTHLLAFDFTLALTVSSQLDSTNVHNLHVSAQVQMLASLLANVGLTPDERTTIESYLARILPKI